MKMGADQEVAGPAALGMGLPLACQSNDHPVVDAGWDMNLERM